MIQLGGVGGFHIPLRKQGEPLDAPRLRSGLPKICFMPSDLSPLYLGAMRCRTPPP